MKIALFYKSYALKALLSFTVILCTLGMPFRAHANIFSNIVTKVLGADDTVVEEDSKDEAVVYNSQNLPLLIESSVNPDFSNIKDEPDSNIIQNETFISNNGPLGPAYDIEKYASSEEINVYKVKKGDTIEGIAKKFKVSKDAIYYSNTDLKKSDLIKVGQTLVIVPLVDSPVETVPKASQKSVASKKSDKPQEEEGIIRSFDIDMSKLSSNKPEAESPSSTSSQDYIWPFPKGVGRVSQGLHDDNAYDFAAPKGTPIYAIHDGTVLVADKSGYNGGYGLYVVINFTDGRQAIFGHMSKVASNTGDVVKQGDIIGYVGSTGRSTGPHVHIGFHKGVGTPYISLKVNNTSKNW